MTWWKGEDSWDDCELFNGLSADAVALFFRAQARMARQLSDGVLTVTDLEHLNLGRPRNERRRATWRRLMTELVERGILAVEGDHWRDVGWLARNPSQVEVGLQRKWDALRQRIRFAASTEKDELRVEEEAVKKQLFAARQARKVAYLTSESPSESLRPVPDPSLSRPDLKVEDEDESSGDHEAPAASLVALRSEEERIASALEILTQPDAYPPSRKAAERELRTLGVEVPAA